MGSPLQRLSGQRHYRRLIVVSCEGCLTEPTYFAFFRRYERQLNYHLELIHRNGAGEPRQVLQKLVQWQEHNGVWPGDELWLVVDVDDRPATAFLPLVTWADGSGKDKIRRALAVSNPKFEFWLLLHFEDGEGAKTRGACVKRLKEHLPDYDKAVDLRAFTAGNIREAITRARISDTPPAMGIPVPEGRTMVYRLVERLLPAVS